MPEVNKINTEKIEKEIGSVFKKFYPDSRDIFIETKTIDFDKDLSAPYTAKIGDTMDMCADHIKKMTFTIKCEVHHKYNPHFE